VDVDERVIELDGVFDGDELGDAEELAEGLTELLIVWLGL
jgi:hypothetical protein